MEKEAYEKIATGRNLNRILGKNEKLNMVESYLIHVETVDGSDNNYIENSKTGNRELSDIYVSKDDITSLKMI